MRQEVLVVVETGVWQEAHLEIGRIKNSNAPIVINLAWFSQGWKKETLFWVDSGTKELQNNQVLEAMLSFA